MAKSNIKWIRDIEISVYFPTFCLKNISFRTSELQGAYQNTVNAKLKLFWAKYYIFKRQNQSPNQIEILINAFWNEKVHNKHRLTGFWAKRNFLAQPLLSLWKKRHLFRFGDKIIHIYLRIIKGWLVQSMSYQWEVLEMQLYKYLWSVNQPHTSSALSICHSYQNISGL